MFNALKKGVGNSVNILTLDGIVNDILKNHETELFDLIAKRDTPISEEEATGIEDVWRVKFNESYDKRASQAMGQKIPENWQEDKELICVRKRMVNRGLDKHKGTLKQKLEEKTHNATESIRLVIVTANKSLVTFSEGVTGFFPMKESDLEILFTQNRDAIYNEAKIAVPDIIEKSLKFSDNPELSWHLFMLKVAALEEGIRRNNQRCITSKIKALKHQTICKLAQDISAVFDMSESAFQNELYSSAYLTEKEIRECKLDFITTCIEMKREVLSVIDREERKHVADIGTIHDIPSPPPPAMSSSSAL